MSANREVVRAVGLGLNWNKEGLDGGRKQALLLLLLLKIMLLLQELVLFLTQADAMCTMKIPSAIQQRAMNAPWRETCKRDDNLGGLIIES